MTNIEVLNVFFLRIYEKDVHEKLLDDIDFSIPFENIKRYMLHVIDIPYSEYLKYLDTHTWASNINTSDITQCSSLDACTSEMCEILSEDENRGKTFLEIGQSKIFEKYVHQQNKAAWLKYGENQVKTANQLGLSFEYYGYWYLSCYGYIYPSLTKVQQNKFLARALLRNPFYADVIRRVRYSEIYLQEYMKEISPSTQGRRSYSIIKLLQICFHAMDIEKIKWNNIYYPYYNSSSKKISILKILATKHNLASEHIHENYVLGTVPLYSIKAACGYFDQGEIPEQSGWIDVLGYSKKIDKNEYFAVYARGDSMLPMIKNGDICLFKWYRGEDLDGKIVLTQCRDFDSDYDSKYTIKKFTCFANKSIMEDKIIFLMPLNTSKYRPVILKKDDERDYKIVGVFIKVLSFIDNKRQHPSVVSVFDNYKSHNLCQQNLNTISAVKNKTIIQEKKYWIFPTNTSHFDMDGWLKVSNVVEFTQRNKVHVGDIIYLYCVRPVKKIKYKMVVTKINIPYENTIDDSAYNVDHTNGNAQYKEMKFCQFKFLKVVNSSSLSLDNLREHGLKSCVQGALTVSGDLLHYIESEFSK